jgi:signal peptidase I
MFEKLTEAAIKSIMLAQEESRRLRRNYVGTEQMLLGLIGEGRGLAASALQTAGIDLDRARAEVDNIIGFGDDKVSLGLEIPFTPRSERMVRGSWAQAQRLHHDYIGTEHLLLALIEDADGVGYRVLKNLNADVDQIRSAILSALGGSFPGSLPSAPMIPPDTADLRSGAFSWYDEDAVVAVQRAWGIAETVGAPEIRSEHLALAVLRDDDTIFSALQAVNLELADIRRELLKLLEPASGRPAKSLPFSADARKVLELSWLAAAQKEERRVSKEYLLLGLTQLHEGALVRALNILSKSPTDLENNLHSAIKASKEKKATAVAESSSSEISGAGVSAIAKSLTEPKQSTTRSKIKRLAGIVSLVALAIVLFMSMNLPSNPIESLGYMVTLQAVFWVCIIAGAIYGFMPSARARAVAQQLKLFPLHNPNLRKFAGLLIFGPLIVIYGITLIYADTFTSLVALYVLIGIIVLLPILFLLVPSMPILTGSMSPALIPGDGVVAELFSRFVGRRFKRGDIVIFRAKREVVQFIPQEVLQTLADFSTLASKLEIITLCKRLVGVPGDRIEISDGRLKVNGQELDEPWAKGFQYNLRIMSDIGYLNYHPFPNQHEPIIVPADSYFVLGDHRSGANIDSHVFGFVKARSVWGRILCVFWRDGNFKLIQFSRGA